MTAGPLPRSNLHDIQEYDYNYQLLTLINIVKTLENCTGT